ncbi:sulfite exporter TauE/SafE family protein 3 isoform X1 [Ricinus communis]|uniref:sulfite exporter TauE/SafE family protein 3 isoform X1 n=2 Tax=Ricinus communis TaxID=3988 RepID=UPI00201B2165|nr:sulfite exporter TauE/SafE family protein 3 isoform X1 [Ricinus communis]
MMDCSGLKEWNLRLRKKYLVGLIVVASMVIVAESASSYNQTQQAGYLHHGNKGHSDYKHVWPEMRIGWRIVVGAIIGFFGAAFGSAGGVGGGGIYVPMLTLIIGFDAKSSIAISKCMITGAAASTVYYNLKQRHPTLEMPVIDYDLALLIQPMLVLGVSIGVTFNVIFADWMITVLLIIIFIFMSTKAFSKGIQTWKKETIKKKEAVTPLELNGDNAEVVIPTPPPEILSDNAQIETKGPKKEKVSLIENVYWKALGLLLVIWFMILALQIAKNYTKTCTVPYWILDFAQIPVAASLTIYQAVRLYKGRRKIASRGEAGSNWRVHKLLLYCFSGLLAGIIGGLLGLGGGFILGPLFLEMGIPPQVSSATATFAMTFSASMSVVEYYLLKRFPVPYALYPFAVTTLAGFVGQYVVKKVIDMLGRASIIIFILSFTILVSAISLGGVGLADMIKKIERKEYMGFEDICLYS